MPRDRSRAAAPRERASPSLVVSAVRRRGDASHDSATWTGTVARRLRRDERVSSAPPPWCVCVRATRVHARGEARAALDATRGLFVLDVFGGGDVLRGRRKTRRPVSDEGHDGGDSDSDGGGGGGSDFAGVELEFETASWDPIAAEQHCRINFLFPDGSAMRGAFEYNWRLWSIPELRDVLADAGFSRTHGTTRARASPRRWHRSCLSFWNGLSIRPRVADLSS